MGFHVIGRASGLDQAITRLRDALTEWAGGAADSWGDATTGGASFSRRDDVYLFIERDEDSVSIGAAMTARDEETVRITLPRKAPARDRKRVTLVLDDDDAPFLMVATDVLRAQAIRDPLKRLAGQPNVKRAAVAGRDYLLLGPLDQAKSADALVALAALSPKFEAHVDKLGTLADEHDGDLYLASAQVAAAHRVSAKVSAALMARLEPAGFQRAHLSNGPVGADLTAAGEDGTLAIAIRPDAAVAEFLQALGTLTLIAPKGGAFRRALVLPAPRDQTAGALAPFDSAFREIGVWVLLYDFKDGTPRVWSHTTPADLPESLRAAFA